MIILIIRILLPPSHCNIGLYLLCVPVQLIQEHVVHPCIQRIRHNSNYHIWYDNVLQVSETSY